MDVTAFNPGLVDRKLPRPVLMLKDYLLDDLSSCSSNGFKSFARRQQCGPSSVRFLLEIEIELKAMGGTAPRRGTSFSRQVCLDWSLKRIPSKAASSTISALHKASMKIINAVKLLTFPSVAKSISSPETGGKSRRCLFPRNLSRRLLKKRFLRKAEAEQPHIGQWKLYRNILAEKDTQAQLDRSSSSIRNATFTGRLASATSWDYSEFSDIITYGGNNSSATEGGALVVSVEKDLLSLPKPDEGTPDQEEEVSERVGADVGGIQEVESPGTAPREACSVDWPNEEKEQFSPLSVLDCPFEDDDDDDDPGSASMCSPTHGGGSRKRNGLMRGRRVKSLSRLEPLSLDKRLSSSELENGPLEPTGLESLSTPSTGNCFGVISEVKTRSEELLRAVMINNPDIGPAEENLLYDFFIQKLESGCADELEALKAAEGWLTKGTPRGIRDGWEVQSGRVAYVRDMEENCKGWRTSGEEHMEVALEVDDEVWRGLIVEILHDL